jgi:hypothetical protein
MPMLAWPSRSEMTLTSCQPWAEARPAWPELDAIVPPAPQRASPLPPRTRRRRSGGSRGQRVHLRLPPPSAPPSRTSWTARLRAASPTSSSACCATHFRSTARWRSHAHEERELSILSDEARACFDPNIARHYAAHPGEARTREAGGEPLDRSRPAARSAPNTPRSAA